MMKEEPSPGLTEMLGRALTDYEFRNALFENREEVIKDFKLTKHDLDALERLDRAELETQADRLGGRAAITIKVVISKSF